MARAAAPVREAVLEALPATPSALRPRLAEAAEPGALEGRLAGAVDRAIAAQPDAAAPDEPAVDPAGDRPDAQARLLVFAVAWIVLWVLLRPPVGIDRGPDPRAGAGAVRAARHRALVAGFMLARLLVLHAGFVGRRWAGRLAARLRGQVDSAVTDKAFAAVDRLEAARRALWIASREAEAAGR